MLSDSMDLDPLLPELYCVLGEDAFVALLRVFSGRTIALPKVTDVREAYNSVKTYQRVEEERSRGKTARDAVKVVAAEMSTTPDKASRRYGLVRKTLMFVSKSTESLSTEESVDG
jgi:hypothetical protein